MPDKIRVGIVGATVTQGGSGWGANAHVPAIKLLPEYELKAVCTSHEETAKASKEKFGAELAFHDINDMAAHPDIDLIVVSVRVPWHRDLVMAGLKAGKPVFCEWPLGANLAEAEEMATSPRRGACSTMVGLQARSDPSVMYARDLIAAGPHRRGADGEPERGQQRADRARRRAASGRASARNGANTFTIAGGHAIDALCASPRRVRRGLGRLATRIKDWQNTERARPVPVDSPDVSASPARLQSGAEVSVHVAGRALRTPAASVLEIYGTRGRAGHRGGAHEHRHRTSLPRQGQGPADRDAEYRPSTSWSPEGTPSGPPRNVAQAYVRAADALAAGGTFAPDFELAVDAPQADRRDRALSAEGKAVKVSH